MKFPIEDNSNLYVLGIKKYFNSIVKTTIPNLYSTCEELITHYNCKIYNPHTYADNFYFGYINHYTAGSVILAEFQDDSSKLEYLIKHPDSIIPINGLRLRMNWKLPKNFMKNLGGCYTGKYWEFSDKNVLKQILKTKAQYIKNIY